MHPLPVLMQGVMQILFKLDAHMRCRLYYRSIFGVSYITHMQQVEKEHFVPDLDLILQSPLTISSMIFLSCSQSKYVIEILVSCRWRFYKITGMSYSRTVKPTSKHCQWAQMVKRDVTYLMSDIKMETITVHAHQLITSDLKS